MAMTTNFMMAKKLGLLFIPIFLFYNFHNGHWSIIFYEDTNISANFISDNPIRADRNKSALDQIEDSILKKMNNSIKVTKLNQFPHTLGTSDPQKKVCSPKKHPWVVPWDMSVLGLVPMFLFECTFLIQKQHVEESPYILSPNTPIKDKTVAEMVNTTMHKLKSKNSARYLYTYNIFLIFINIYFCIQCLCLSST